MTTDARHSKQTSTNGGVHTIVAFIYANETARLAATGFVPGDVGKVALDQDTNELNWLVDDDPITWATFDAGEATGETNTASNVGTAGVGVFKQKSDVDFEFKKINAGSAKVTVTDDTGNDEVDINVVTGTDANSVCVGNDSRLSDSRAPTSHASSHDAGGGDAMAIDAVAGTGSLRTLGTSATSACAGNDSRLSDNRTDADAIHDNVAGEIAAITAKGTPTTSDYLVIEDAADSNNKKSITVGDLPASAPASHASSHNAGGGDALAIDAAAGTGSLRTLGTASTAACAGDDSRLSDSRAPTSHASTHDAGGGDAMAIDAVAGTGSLRTLGTSATSACAGNDSRLSDSRTPTSHSTSHENGGGDEISVAGLSGLLADGQTPLSHATSHQSGGADAIKLDDLASPDDNTDLDSTTSAHGLLPKLSGGTTNYLRADGTWAEPSGGSGEANTASNVGTAGVGVFKQKSDVDFEFKKINAGSAKVTVTDDTGNDEVDINVVTGTDANSVCVGNDSRLSDSRAPTSHASSHDAGGGDAMAIDAVAGTGSLRTLGTSATSACAGNDSRLSDSRTPTSHATSHQNGGGDEISVAGLSGLLADGQTPLSHASTHDAGGGDAMAIDAVAGTGSLRTLGTSATSACAGDDSRLSDSRTPTSHSTSHENGGGDEISVAGLSGLLADGQTPLSHATSHQSGGADAIKLDDLASPDDNTDLDSTTSAHGLLPKLSGGTTNYLRADGTWAEPSGGSGEANTASNVGTAGVGVFKQKSDVDFEFKKINAGSAKVTVTDDTGNDEVDINVVTGTDANSVCIGNDSRLSDSRTPTSHASTHQSGGGDAIKIDDLAAADDNTDLNATTSAHGLLPKLGGGTTNYLRADGTWAAPAGGGGSGDDAKQFFADQLDTPVTSDWPVTTRAAGNKDSNNTGLAVRRFDDTTEEGVGFILEIPTGVTDIIVEFRSRAETSAASNLNVVPKLYYREIPDNAAVESWGNSTMTAITMGTSNEYFQYDSQTIALSTLSLVAGRVAQFELTRDAGAAGDTLVGDWSLLMVKVSFS